MKKVCLFFGLFLITSLMYGQTDDLIKAFEDFQKQQNQQFDDFSQKKQAEYDSFRKAMNERYAEFMRNSWAAVKATPMVLPEEEKPIEPIIYKQNNQPEIEPEIKPNIQPEVKPKNDRKENKDTEDEQEENLEEDLDVDENPKEDQEENLEEDIDENLNEDLEIEEHSIPIKEDVILIPMPLPLPEPIAPVVPKEDIAHKIVSISFYGTLVSVGFPTSDDLQLTNLSENTLADTWLQLSDEKYDITVNNVIEIRDNLSLCDWGYIKMLQAITEKQYGQTNEAIMMQAYLMSQSNYKVRLARTDKKLYLLVASQCNILSMYSFVLDGDKFYALNCNEKQLHICDAAFDTEQAISLQLRKEQNLDNALTPERKLTSRFGIEAYVHTNKNDIDFYNDYPSAYIGNNTMTRWAVYANTPLSNHTQRKLYPTLKNAIIGLSERDAVNKILNFVQTAFTYEYDNKVWGGDRPFFAEETLYYPYSDCEDRSILFTRLVKDIIGLDVVLIYYPGHLATAVRFNQPIQGDYLMYNNQRYTICDPTYVNAPVGMTMPDMNNQEAQVISLSR
jgi:hypothetical protein